MSGGVDRRTGERLSNFDSALQCVEVILLTRIGSRVMRRDFGAGVVELLGRRVDLPLLEALRQSVGTAIDLYEPRFSVQRVHFTGSEDTLRAGQAGMRIEVDWRPGALLGDETVESRITFGVLSNGKIDRTAIPAS